MRSSPFPANDSFSDTSFNETSTNHNSSTTTSTINDPLNLHLVPGGLSYTTILNCGEPKARYDEDLEEAKRAGPFPDGDEDYYSSSDIVFDDAASVNTVSTSTSIKDDTPAPVAWMCRSGILPELYAQ
ncbi:hypothetical protein ABVK25_004096 [Lepraria finkii]|uniref:Uncharacterized protein n=1 Tax=Lepraria finkii TaxID=1340010 RepID=A0ABR4BDD3_9LECA